MRFPTGNWSDIRRVVAAHVRRIPRARARALLAALLLGSGALANVYVPVLLGRIVDAALGNRAANLGAIGTLLALSAVASACLSAAGFYVLSRLSERVIANLREDMVGTALGLPVHRVEEAGSGDLVSRSTDDVAELSSAVTDTVPTLSASVFAILSTEADYVGVVS